MGTTVTMAFHLGNSALCRPRRRQPRVRVSRRRAGATDAGSYPHRRFGAQRSASAGPGCRSYRLRHVITNVVGGQEVGVRVEAQAFEVQAGDWLLLCSDGLTEMVSNETIATTLSADLGPEDAAKTLLALADEAGGLDNITILLARFDVVPAYTPSLHDTASPQASSGDVHYRTAAALVRPLLSGRACSQDCLSPSAESAGCVRRGRHRWQYQNEQPAGSRCWKWTASWSSAPARTGSGEGAGSRLQQGQQQFVIDLGKVPYMDSSGLGELVQATPASPRGAARSSWCT